MTESLKSKNIDLTKYSIEYLKQTGVRNFMKEIKISKIQLLWLYKNIKSKIKDHQLDCPLVDNFKKQLPKLSKKYKLLVFSSNTVETINKYLVRNNIDKYFSGVYEDNSYFGKEIGLNKIIKKLKINKNDVYYLGDESRDIIAAHKAGVKSVAVTWGFEGNVPLSSVSPDFLINKPEELLSLKF
jgi:HAD superfamily hydrolase (TIGR01549 family)